MKPVLKSFCDTSGGRKFNAELTRLTYSVRWIHSDAGLERGNNALAGVFILAKAWRLKLRKRLKNRELTHSQGGSGSYLPLRGWDLNP